jgi:serine/threonine protein kinase
MYEGERVVILVVQEEEAFGELLQHFPMDDYTLMFAAEPAEALALCEIKTPRLIVVPTAFAGGGLADVLAEVRPAEALILGLAPTREDVGAATGHRGIFDRVVFGGDASALVETAKELLKERRLSPRVNLEFPIHIGEKGEGIVREFSATSLRIETSEQLRSGAIVKVSIGWGPRPLKFEAVVGRVDETMFFGQVAAVLHLHDQEAQAKEYLDVLVRRVVELQYLLAGDETDNQGKLRGTSAWDLARRAEKILRDSKGLKIRDSGELVVDEKATAEASAAKPGAEAGPDEDVLESRYKLGEKIDTWGVGDVYKATHRLLERPVLLKRLRPELTGDVNARLRLELEARVAAGFAGKNIVDVLDFGSDGRGGLYYAMESMNGETLAAALERGQAFAPLEIASLGIHLTYALARIHLRGGGHFDLCPQNIYLKRTMGTTVVPVLINVAGPEVWTQPSPAYTRGSDYRPPDAPLSYPGPDCDVYALTMVLQEVLSVSTHLAGGLKSPGVEDLLQVLRMAGARDRNERIVDAQSLREALAKSLSMLEAENDGEVPGNVTQPPPAIGRPRPSQLGSIPAPDLADSYLEKVMALEGAVPIAGLRRPSRTSTLPSIPPQGAQSVAGSTRRPTRPAPTPPPMPLGTFGGAPSTAEGSSIQLVEDDLEIVDFAPDPVPPPRGHGATLPAPPPVLAAAAPATNTATTVPAPAVSTASGRRGAVLGIVIGAGVVAALALVALVVWQPWRRGTSDEVSTVLGSRIAPPAADAAPPRDPSKRLEIGDAQVASLPATVVPAVAPPVPVVPVVNTPDAGAAADASKIAPEETGPADTTEGDEEDGGAAESPAEARRTLMGKARRRVRRGLYNEALEFLAAAAEIRNGADIQSLLAEVYEKRGQYRPALVSAKRAVDLAPTNARYHDQLGSLYVKQGQRPQACASFRQATTLNPTLSSAKRHLGQYCR